MKPIDVFLFNLKLLDASSVLHGVLTDPLIFKINNWRYNVWQKEISLSLQQPLVPSSTVDIGKLEPSVRPYCRGRQITLKQNSKQFFTMINLANLSKSLLVTPILFVALHFPSICKIRIYKEIAIKNFSFTERNSYLFEN